MRMKLSDFCEINPRVTLKKGQLAKKIAMTDLPIFGKSINSYRIEEYNGGTKFQNGDTLMARITPCLENGKGGYVDILDEGEVAFGSTEYIVFRGKLEVSDSQFLYYFINTHEFREIAIKSMTGTSGRQRVQTDLIANMEFDFPELEEQRKIATILCYIDEKIKVNNKLNANLVEQARVLYKNWFIDFEPFKDSIVGEYPEGWAELTLEEVTNMSAGGDKPKQVSQVPENDCIIPIYSNGVDKEGLYGYTDKAKILQEAVTVSARGTIGFVCLRQEPYVPIVRLISLEPKQDVISAKYLYLFLSSINITGTGTTQQQLTVPDFKKTKILIPNYSVNKQFTELVNPLFELIKAKKEENIKLSDIRDTLLPKLMSGEISLSELELDIC